SVPTTAMIGYLPTSALGTASVTLPLASVLPCTSPVSHLPLLFLSRQTTASLIAPSTTVVLTSVVVGAGGVLLPPPPPPQAASASNAAALHAARPNRSSPIFINAPVRLSLISLPGGCPCGSHVRGVNRRDNITATAARLLCSE